LFVDAEGEGRKIVKYLLMMNTMKAGGMGLPNWTQEELMAHITYMMELNKELKSLGELVMAEGLTFPDQARLVKAGDDGEPITDGVFPESKEFLAGFWIVDVGSPERAYRIAARASAAPGAGGRPLNMAIEVRPVMPALPEMD
jgi:hypothetical protein